MSECKHPYLAIQPELLSESGTRTVALCINPDCALHAMALRIVDQSVINEVRAIASEAWKKYQHEKRTTV